MLIDQVAGNQIEGAKDELPSQRAYKYVGEHHPSQKGRVSVGVAIERAPVLPDVPGSVSEHPVIHVSVFDFHVVVLVIAIKEEGDPDQGPNVQVGVELVEEVEWPCFRT